MYTGLSDEYERYFLNRSTELYIVTSNKNRLNTNFQTILFILLNQTFVESIVFITNLLVIQLINIQGFYFLLLSINIIV